jgi:hypothetical protein
MVFVRGLGDGGGPLNRLEWAAKRDKAEALSRLLYITGGAAAIFLIGEGHLDYAALVGSCAVGAGDLCHLTYEPNRFSIVVGAAGMVVIGVAGFWFLRRMMKRWEDEGACFTSEVSFSVKKD